MTIHGYDVAPHERVEIRTIVSAEPLINSKTPRNWRAMATFDDGWSTPTDADTDIGMRLLNGEFLGQQVQVVLTARSWIIHVEPVD